MQYNCDLKHSPSDGGSVTWHELTLSMTALESAEVLPLGIVEVIEGSSVTLNWSYSLKSGLVFGVIKFNDDNKVTLIQMAQLVLLMLNFRNGSALVQL